MKSMSYETKGMLFGLIGIFAFGLTLPATKIVLPYLDPVFIGLGRAVLAAVFAAIFLIIFPQKIPSKIQFLQLALVALGVVIGFPLFSSIAMVSLPASHGVIVFGILPLLTAFIGMLFGHETPDISFWMVSIFGSVLVLCYAFLQSDGGFQFADLALLMATISAAIGYAMGAMLTKSLGGWQT
ncbi:MAG: DMT family transporter, partial [Thiohalomonadales bacterium]